MAKTTKYKALKKIIRLNGKNYEVGSTVTGLSNDQEQRLTDLAAIEATETIEAPTEKPEKE